MDSDDRAPDVQGLKHFSVPATASRPGRRSRRSAFAAIAILIVIGAMAGLAYWSWNRPQHRFQRGLKALAARQRLIALGESRRLSAPENDSLRSDEWAVFHESRRLGSVPGYEPHSHFLAGALLVQSGRWAEALEQFHQVPETSEIVAQAMTLAARCHYQLGRFPNAIRVALKALEKTSGNKKQAADMLGLKRTTLSAKLRTLDAA